MHADAASRGIWPSRPDGLYADHLIAALPALVSAVARDARRALLEQAADAGGRADAARSVQGDCSAPAPAGSTACADVRGARRPAVVAGRARGRSAASRGARRTCRWSTTTPSSARSSRSRLALAIMDRASWEFADLRSRMASLERRDELDATRPAARPRAGAHRDRGLARAGMSLDGWRELQPVLHEEFAHCRRRGLPRGQPLADRAARAARGRPAAAIRRSRGANTGGSSRRLRRQPGDGADLAARRLAAARAAWATRRA